MCRTDKKQPSKVKGLNTRGSILWNDGDDGKVVTSDSRNGKPFLLYYTKPTNTDKSCTLNGKKSTKTLTQNETKVRKCAESTVIKEESKMRLKGQNDKLKSPLLDIILQESHSRI